MPRKIRRTKGRAKTEEFYRINKKTGNERNHYTDLGRKIVATERYLHQGESARKVAADMDIPRSTVERVANRARKLSIQHRRPLADISNYQVQLGRGRPTIFSQSQGDALAAYVTSSRIHRMKTAQQHIIDLKLQISVELFQNLMYERGLARRRCGWKTILNDTQRQARYQFALRYKAFNWRNVIYTDEASIRGLEVRGYVRGWGLLDDKYHKDMIQGKGDGYSMGMIWGAFAYGVKGPVHFYRTETEEEKKTRAHQLDVENAEEQPNIWLAYMATEALKTNPATGKRRGGKATSINNFAKKKLKMRGDRSNGGIDWLIHRDGGLAKLVEWIQELRIKYPERDWVVYEDGARAHWSPHCQAVFDIHKIERLIDLPARSPELNSIEQAWAWIRKDITCKEGRLRGISSNWQEACNQWMRSWEDLDQDIINKWIDRIPHRLQQIIDAKGGNDFHG